MTNCAFCAPDERCALHLGILDGVNLIGIHEIAQVLEVSRQRADQLSRREGFPKPVAELQMGRVWRLSDFEKWRQKHGR